MTDAVDRMGDDWLAEAETQITEQPVETVEAIQPEVVEQPNEEVEQEIAEQPNTEPKQTHTVPYGELKSEREKRQALERELQSLRTQQQPQPAPEAPKVPDPYEDPQGYDQYVQNTIQQQAFGMRLEMSGRLAEQTYGKDTVDQAIAWGNEQARLDPSLSARFKQQADPVGFVVSQYRQSQTLQALGDKSPEDFAREYAVSQGWIVSQPPAEGQAQQKPSAPKVPKGLASVAGSGAKAPANADWGEVKFALDK